MTPDLVVRRVITGNDATGGPVVLADSSVGDVRTLPSVAGWAIATIWQDNSAPTIPLESVDDGLGSAQNQLLLAEHGTRFLIWRLPPETSGENPAGIHKTDTLDFIVVMSGTVVLALGDGRDVELSAGDCLVQGGNLHHWRNLSTEPCLMAVFMVGARRRA